MEFLWVNQKLVYKFDGVIYDTLGLVDNLFNMVNTCYYFVKETPGSDTRYDMVLVIIKKLGEYFRGVVLSGCTSSYLKDFAKCGLMFLEALITLIYTPMEDWFLDSFVKWYENVENRYANIKKGGA